MDYILLNQTELVIEVDTKIDLSELDTAIVKFTKPDGVTTGSWSFSLSADPSNTVIEHDVQSGELDMLGSWICWCYLTFSDGDVAPGIPYEMIVHEEGKFVD